MAMGMHFDGDLIQGLVVLYWSKTLIFLRDEEKWECKLWVWSLYKPSG